MKFLEKDDFEFDLQEREKELYDFIILSFQL